MLLTPFPNMQSHPMGVIPKKKLGKFPSILDISYPPHNSINVLIAKDENSLHYVTVDKAILSIKRLRRAFG